MPRTTLSPIIYHSLCHLEIRMQLQQLETCSFPSLDILFPHWLLVWGVSEIPGANLGVSPQLFRCRPPTQHFISWWGNSKWSLTPGSVSPLLPSPKS